MSNSRTPPSGPRPLRQSDAATAQVESLNHDSLGVARVSGKAVFIEGALPGETVRFVVHKRRKSYDLGKTLEILNPAPERVTPRCRYVGVCGGCSLQHLRDEAQLPNKQRLVRDNLERIGKVSPESWLAPLAGPYWGYRRKARLGVCVVEKQGGVIVGFRERSSAFVTPLASCEVLDPRASALLPALRTLIAGLSRPDRIPQIEVAAGDDDVALAFRHLDPLAGLNHLMIRQALELLDPQPDERVLDLFCGLGNFTLPLARRAGWVTGIESDPALVEKGRHNARRNALDNVEFRLADLYKPDAPDPWGAERFDKWLLDPPRTGAAEVVRRLPAEGGPRRILYVSCNPATLARDAEVLVHAKGYRLVAVGAMDMFPQTSHIESMALFARSD
jgi:23S rRNA (uracil1939-C5)-methyltransferase